MTPTEIRNERLAKKIMKNLTRRHFESYFCKNAAEAIHKVMQLMPQGSTVTWGGSMTLRDMGLTQAVKQSGHYTVYDRDEATTPQEAAVLPQGLPLRLLPHFGQRHERGRRAGER